MTAYLAGPMSGYDDDNFPTFNRVAAILRSRGWDIVNPAEFHVQHDPVIRELPEAIQRALFLQYDISELVQCDAIVLLPGWQQSKGANIELLVALASGLAVFETTTDGDVRPRFNVLPLPGRVFDHLTDVTKASSYTPAKQTLEHVRGDTVDTSDFDIEHFDILDVHEYELDCT